MVARRAAVGLAWQLEIHLAAGNSPLKSYKPKKILKRESPIPLNNYINILKS